MNEIPKILASHPRLIENPGLALQETFERVDGELGEALKENEQVYRYAWLPYSCAMHMDSCLTLP